MIHAIFALGAPPLAFIGAMYIAHWFGRGSGQQALIANFHRRGFLSEQFYAFHELPCLPAETCEIASVAH